MWGSQLPQYFLRITIFLWYSTLEFLETFHWIGSVVGISWDSSYTAVFEMKLPICTRVSNYHRSDTVKTDGVRFGLQSLYPYSDRFHRTSSTLHEKLTNVDLFQQLFNENHRR